MLNLKVELGIDVPSLPASAHFQGNLGPKLMKHHYLWCFMEFVLSLVARTK